MIQTTDIVVDIEKKFDLFNFKIRGFNVWWMCRIKTFETLEFSRKVFENNNNINKSSIKSKLGYLKFLRNVNLFPQTYEKTDILCISNMNLRREIVNDKYFDILFDYIGKYDSDNDYAILNTLSGRGFVKNYYTDKCYNMSNFALYINMCRKMYKLILTKQEIKAIVDKFTIIEEYLKREYDLNIDLINIVAQNTAVIIKGYNKALKILNKIKPKVIYVECAYSPTHLVFIYAAKELGIEVVEFQHGMISEEHLGYRYNKNVQKNDPIPDYLCVFGSHFKEVINNVNPKSDLKIIEYGYPYLLEKAIQSNLDDNMNKKFDMVITTQGVVYAEYWCEFVKNITRECKGIKILIKVHPNEVMSYNQSYEEILQMENVSFSIYESVYDCLKISNIHLSCYSTCHYEALLYDIPTFVVKFPGWWYIDSLEKYNVPFIEDSHELLDYIKHDRSNNILFDEFKNDFFNFNKNGFDTEVLRKKIVNTNKFFLGE